jgi:hypothetical protein
MARMTGTMSHHLGSPRRRHRREVPEYLTENGCEGLLGRMIYFPYEITLGPRIEAQFWEYGTLGCGVMEYVFYFCMAEWDSESWGGESRIGC